MYNRYLNTAYEERSRPFQEIHTPHDSSSQDHAEPLGDKMHEKPEGGKSEGGGLLSGLSEALTGRLKNLHFDMDTLIIIIAVYFLLADSEDFDSDLLVLIGVMFVLGL